MIRKMSFFDFYLALAVLLLILVFKLYPIELISAHEFEATIANISIDGVKGVLRVDTKAYDKTSQVPRFLTVFAPVNTRTMYKGQNLTITCDVDALGGIHIDTCKW